MDIDRRSLMKGLLASGTLLALGTPPWSFANSPVRRPKQCMLLLGGSSADEAFAHGSQTACAAMACGRLPIVTLKGALLAGDDEAVTLLEHSVGTRWITVMDDAAAMIFIELVRTTGATLVSMGMHACSHDAPCHLRHDFASTSSDHGAGGLLASHFMQQSVGFAITERFLQEPAGMKHGVTSWGAPEFFSHRFTGSDAVHVHCSGCSFPAGSRLLGLDTTQKWIPIPPQARAGESVTWQFRNWIESVGYAVTASALGAASVRESCTGRAFVRRLSDERRTQPAERFTSFILDV
ncbi:hypothetical protein [Nitrospira sp. Nam80]